MIKTIIKFDGTKEPWIAEKFSRWNEWAATGLGIDWPTIMLDVVNESSSVMSSQDLQLKAIEHILRGETWSHYLMAGAMYAPYLTKHVFGNSVPSVQVLHAELLERGYMTKLKYSDKEYAEVEKLIDHDADKTYPHFRLEYIYKKYALQNRVVKKIYETPQFVYMRMAMALAEGQPKGRRMKDVAGWYNHLKDGRLNAPSPNFINLGTPLNGYASCCIYTSGDTARSIGVGMHIAYTMTYMSAGCGTHLNTRSLGDAVRHGMIEHQGKLPYIRGTKAMVEANLQNGRGGADTLSWQAYDPEGEVLVGLQNPMSVDTRKIRGIDYSMGVNLHLARLAQRKQKMFRFNCFTAPDLYEALYSGDTARFDELYEKYEADPLFVKSWFSAREIILLALNEAYETGRYYLTWLDQMNYHTPFYDPIYASNLCVAPETKILTDKGYIAIKDAVGKANIWNGVEWSEVDVVKTGTNQELVMVVTDSGQTIECTPYHKFYVVDDYGLAPREVRAGELKFGDKLIKFDLPVIEGIETLDKAYINGFYSGDGCVVGNQQRIYLYGEKRALKEKFVEGSDWYYQNEFNRMQKHYKDLQDKFFVPDNRYSVKSRLDWLAGFADADGCIYRNGTNQQLVMSSVNFKFLQEIQYMLNTLGVSAKIKQFLEKGIYQLPLNNGTGEKGDFECNAAWRLIVTSVDLQSLMKLGLEFGRLQVVAHTPQRCAKHFIKIVSVLNTGRVDDTYCFTEPKRHMGVFNGILTGQCQEIMLCQQAYEHMLDLYQGKDVGWIKMRVEHGGVEESVNLTYASPVLSTRGEAKDGRQQRTVIAAGELRVGDTYRTAEFTEYLTVLEVLDVKREPEVAMCNIGGIVPAMCENDEVYADVAYYALLMVDICIHKAEYELPHIGFTSKARLNAGIGIMGLAYWMAKNGHRYDDEAGRNAQHRLYETHLYHLITQSIKLGKERGNAPWMHRTKWPEGYLPLDTYKKDVDALHSQPLLRDWDGVRAALIENKGMRFSCVVSHMPGESSSKASGQPNSLYPVRETVHVKTDNGIKSRWAAPEGDRLADQYQSAWDLHWKHQVNMYALAQKFNDQGISADLWRRIPEGEMVSSTEMLEQFFYMTKMGLKSRYYQNSMTSKRKKLDDGSEVLVDVLNTDGEVAADCGAGGCKM